jgi:hypothetical protein
MRTDGQVALPAAHPIFEDVGRLALAPPNTKPSDIVIPQHITCSEPIDTRFCDLACRHIKPPNVPPGYQLATTGYRIR